MNTYLRMFLLLVLAGARAATACTPAPELEAVAPSWGEVPPEVVFRTVTRSEYPALELVGPAGEHIPLLEGSTKLYGHRMLTLLDTEQPLADGDYTLVVTSGAYPTPEAVLSVVGGFAPEPPELAVIVEGIQTELVDGSDSGGYMCSWQETLVVRPKFRLVSASSGGWWVEFFQTETGEPFDWAELPSVTSLFQTDLGVALSTEQVCLGVRLYSPTHEVHSVQDLGCWAVAAPTPNENASEGCSCESDAGDSGSARVGGLAVVGLAAALLLRRRRT